MVVHEVLYPGWAAPPSRLNPGDPQQPDGSLRPTKVCFHGGETSKRPSRLLVLIIQAGEREVVGNGFVRDGSNGSQDEGKGLRDRCTGYSLVSWPSLADRGERVEVMRRFVEVLK